MGEVGDLALVGIPIQSSVLLGELELEAAEVDWALDKFEVDAPAPLIIEEIQALPEGSELFFRSWNLLVDPFQHATASIIGSFGGSSLWADEVSISPLDSFQNIGEELKHSSNSM
jgi:hypothetical protein